MTPRVLSFQQRATRLLASDERPRLEALDALITDGCAEALGLETQLSRLGRRREQALREIDDPQRARAALEIGEELDALEQRLFDLRDAISALMRRRSQQRLSEFLADR